MKFQHSTKQIKLELNTTARHADIASFQIEADKTFRALYRRNNGCFMHLYNSIQKVAEEKKVDKESVQKLIKEMGLKDENGNWIFDSKL